MPHEATNHPTGSVIEAYAIFFKRLADSVYGLFTALGCIMLYTTVIATFLIVYVSATFYIIITTLINMTPRHEADSDNLRAATGIRSGIHDEAIAATVDNSLITTANGSLEDVPILRVNGRIHKIEPQVLTTEHLPAIPPYLEDCEFFYSTADLSLLENSMLLMEADGKPTYSRLTICGECISSDLEHAKTVLQCCELERATKFSVEERTLECGTKFSLEDRILERRESVRGKLELGHRVYVGPAVWLLKVLDCIYETEPQVLTTKLAPAIPPYLEDCEFFYNTADMNLLENSNLLLKGRLQIARLTIDGERISSGLGYANMVLENCERKRVLKFSEGEGVLERSESKRAMLELWNRVYVGPVEWLLKVLEEAA